MLAVLFLQAAYSGSCSIYDLLSPLLKQDPFCTTVLIVLWMLRRSHQVLLSALCQYWWVSLLIFSDGFLLTHVLMSVNVRTEDDYPSDVCYFYSALLSDLRHSPANSDHLILKFSVCLLISESTLPTFSPHFPILSHILETQTKATYQIIVLCCRNMYYRNIVHSKSNIWKEMS